MGERFAGGTLVLLTLLSGASASAQCDIDDRDPNGIPSECPPGSNFIEGTDASETLTGTNGADCIFGLGGDDVIDGLNGDDYICGGDGDDRIDGGNGSDRIDGGGGADEIVGGGGADELSGGDGNDVLSGGTGSDVVDGGPGDDALSGGPGPDTMVGGPGEDILDGGPGPDACAEEVPGTGERLTACDNVTQASVSAFELVELEDGAMVRWETSSEVGTVAFRLWRRGADGALALLTQLQMPPVGGENGAVYVAPDAQASPGVAGEYLLEELTVAGGRTKHGPFVRTLRTESPASGLALAFEPSGWREPRGRVAPRGSRSVARAASALTATAPSSEQPVALELVVDTAGVIELDAKSIAESLQVELPAVRAALQEAGLDLRLAGESQAWHPSPDGEAMRFVVLEPQTPFAAERHYQLALSAGRTMDPFPLRRLPERDAHSFAATLELEENEFAGLTANPDPRGDFYFWRSMSAEDSMSIPVALPDLDGSAAAPVRSLRVYVYGATDLPEQPQHLKLWWNGVLVGSSDLEGRSTAVIEVSLEGQPAGLDNELRIETEPTGPEPAYLFVDRVQIDYQRRARMSGSVFAFSAAVDGRNALHGLGPNPVLLYEISSPDAPKTSGELSAEPDTSSLSFDSSAEARFIAVDRQAVRAPKSVVPRFALGLRDPNLRADYVVISDGALLEGAGQLAERRRLDGHDVLLVSIADVFWEFSDAEPDPLAVRRFLEHAWHHWASPPRFAVLVGEGSYDYRNHGGYGGNAIPAPLVRTDGGLFPADMLLGDVEGGDSVPEIAVGRLPVANEQELARSLQAIERFERNGAGLDVLLGTDASTSGEFVAAQERLAASLAPERRIDVDLNRVHLQEARGSLQSAWGPSLSWLSYVGHGGLDRLSAQGLLTSDDVPALDVAAAAPVVLGWTCNVGRFDIPGFLSLGQELLRQGAAAAVFGPTGWSNHHETSGFRERFAQTAFGAEQASLGEAILHAHRAADDMSPAARQTFALLGDPGLRLQVSASPRAADESAAPQGCQSVRSPRGSVWSAVLLLWLVWRSRRPWARDRRAAPR